MARCDQCHIDGGIRVKKKWVTNLKARFEIEIIGAKMNVCEHHRRKFELALKHEKVELKYHEIKEK